MKRAGYLLLVFSFFIPSESKEPKIPKEPVIKEDEIVKTEEIDLKKILLQLQKKEAHIIDPKCHTGLQIYPKDHFWLVCEENKIQPFFRWSYESSKGSFRCLCYSEKASPLGAWYWTYGRFCNEAFHLKGKNFPSLQHCSLSSKNLYRNN